jgi:hypothetical protein
MQPYTWKVNEHHRACTQFVKSFKASKTSTKKWLPTVIFYCQDIRSMLIQMFLIAKVYKLGLNRFHKPMVQCEIKQTLCFKKYRRWHLWTSDKRNSYFRPKF